MEDRKETKQRHEQYREAARRMVRTWPRSNVRDFVSVNEDANKTGAFIEAVIWVPREEIAD